MNHTYMRWISGGFFVEKHLTQGTLSCLPPSPPGGNSQFCSTHFTIPQVGPGSYPGGKPMTCALFMLHVSINHEFKTRCTICTKSTYSIIQSLTLYTSKRYGMLLPDGMKDSFPIDKSAKETAPQQQERPPF